jgi:monofunctional biosynthetic peptidoglycan transglycosylase
MTGHSRPDDPDVPPPVEEVRPPAAAAAHAGPVDPSGPDEGDWSYETREEEPAERKRRFGCGRIFLVILGLVVLVGLWKLVTWPDVEALADTNPESTAFIDRWERRNDGEARWAWVPYGSISPHLKRAVLVGEDINFFSHDGFERAELEKALEEAWQERKLPRGASTLTQQLAKNLWLSGSYNPLRKVEEALLTRQLEEHLSKRRILEIYLNVAELGPGIYGAEAAARHYFGKSAAGLSEWEAASLAAALPNPRAWHPGSGNGRYDWRVGMIQGRMGKAGWLWNVI